MKKTTRIDAPEAAGFDAIVQGLPAGLVDLAPASRLVEAAGIPVAPWRRVRDEFRLAEAARDLGFPLVMKIDSLDIAHKSDAGGVTPGLRTDDDLRREFREMLPRVQTLYPDARILGVTLHRQLEGVELAVGGSRDPQFGPTVMVGAGGVHIELYRDVVFRVAPVDAEEALRALSELKAQPLLTGFRGSRPVHRPTLAAIVEGLSKMIASCTRVDQVDLNPLICSGHAIAAADVRVVLTE